RKAAITDLSLQLGIRGMKRRVSRTILTLITITVIVSSAIILVNVSIARASRVKEAWPGTDRTGVIIEANILIAPLSEYDINWTRTQEWCEDLGYREEIITLEPELTRWGILTYGDRSPRAEIIAVDPDFLEKHYNFSRYVRGVWAEFKKGEPVAIISNSFEVPVGDYVTLGVGEAGTGSWWTRSFGDFKVIGKFDPSSILKLTKIDNRPLFEETSNLVLVPVGSINDYSMAISEATIIVKEGYDSMEVAKKIAYILGVTTIANSNGLAKKIEWTVEWTVRGFIPYLFPLIIAGLMIYITMTSIYEERRREIMIMATLGLDPKNTFQVFVIEALLLGFMGTLLGFLGSYILVLILSSITGLLGQIWTPVSGTTGLSSYVHWSLPAVLVAMLTGTVMTFLGAYIPASRARGLSLLGRVKRRRLVGEFIIQGENVSFNLPLRVPVQSGDLLYRFVRENVGKFKSSIIDPHSVKGEVRRDGTFTVSFIVREPGRSIYIPCEIKGLREGDSLIPVVEFPAKYRSYERVRRILRTLEEYMIGFASWKDMQRKMKIIREAPKRKKTPEEILIEVKEVIEKIRDDIKRLKFLESRKSQLSEAIYEEFRQKYIKRIDEETSRIRTLAIGLESYRDELKKEIKSIEVEIERYTIAYNLGEITEEEYVKSCGPLQARLDVLRSKFKELEDVFEFLRMPSRIV
ncbi:FtsX-like permease family protein, partial [Candidatus Bathyarchaeota archaeon]